MKKIEGFQVYKFSEMTNKERKLYKRHVDSVNKVTEYYHFGNLTHDQRAQWLFTHGHKLTTKKFWLMAGSSELRKCVSNLRKRGMKIRSERVPGENFHIYWLEK